MRRAIAIVTLLLILVGGASAEGGIRRAKGKGRWHPKAKVVRVAKAKAKAKAKTARRPAARSAIVPSRAPGRAARAVVTAPRSDDPLVRDLEDSLRGVLATKWLKRTVNGVLVVDARTGRRLFGFGAERQLNPASNVKLVSTATALDALGADFTYETRLLGTRPTVDGVVEGDIHLVGSSDPTLRTTDLADLAGDLYAHGVRRITGAIVVGTGELRDGLGASRVWATVVAGSKEGDLPQVSLEPDSGYFQIDATARTTSKGRRARLDVGMRPKTGEHGEERVLVTVSGRIRPGHRVTLARAVPRPALFAGHTLRTFLLRRGIEVAGGVVRARAVPDGAVALARHRSRPLGALVGMVNKPSSNFLADRVIWTTGAQLFGGEPTNGAGLRAMTAFLARVGIAPGTYRLDNGSGLSHASHLSPAQIVSVLRAGVTDFRFGPDYLASLSIGGRDGTLRDRFRGHGVARWIRGKTGTLNGVAALSGLVSAGGDDELCFSILTNGFRHRRLAAVRASQVAMVDAMYRYLVRRRGETAPVPQSLPTVEVREVEEATPEPSDEEAAPEDAPLEPPVEEDESGRPIR